VLHSSNDSPVPSRSRIPPIDVGRPQLSRRGTLFVMTGASGVGKDTIRQATLPTIDNLFYSVSATTRPQRPGEVHGLQYFFYDHARFETMIAADELLEYAEYVGDYYGTPTGPVLENLARGKDVLLELELVGARKVKERLSEAVMVFIAPPSLVELERRLRGRGTDSEEKIQKRLARAREEIKAVREFDYVVVNDHLDEASSTFAAIIKAERARAAKVSGEEIAAFLRES
jgi:guanylate kinase